MSFASPDPMKDPVGMWLPENNYNNYTFCFQTHVISLFLPESSILCCSSSWYNLSNEYPRIIPNVWVICSTSNTEPQARISLEK